MREEGRKPVRTQGLENNFWIILDYGDIVAHIFLTEYRQFYGLEELWADAPHKEYKERRVPKTKKTDRCRITQIRRKAMIQEGRLSA